MRSRRNFWYIPCDLIWKNKKRYGEAKLTRNTEITRLRTDWTRSVSRQICWYLTLNDPELVTKLNRSIITLTERMMKSWRTKDNENQPQLGEATFKAARDRQSLPREKQKATKRFISGTLQNHHRKQVAGTFEKRSAPAVMKKSTSQQAS